MTPGNNVIEVVVQLVDQITAPLGGINRQLGTLKNLGLAALGGWSIGKFIANIAEAEKVSTKLNIAYRNMGASSGVTRGRMNELATEIQDLTTFSATSVKQAEALLLTFSRVRGEAFERTLKVGADLAAMMGMELPSAVRMLGRAAQDPTRGFYMLQRAGIVLTGTQKELIKDMAKAGDTAGAYAKLLELVGQKAGGTAAELRNTLGGAFTALQNQIEDMLEGDSGSFKDATAAVNTLTETLASSDAKRAFDGAVTFVVTLTGVVAGLTVALANSAAAWGELVGSLSMGYGWTGYAQGPEAGVAAKDKKELAQLTNVSLPEARKELEGLQIARKLYGNTKNVFTGRTTDDDIRDQIQKITRLEARKIELTLIVKDEEVRLSQKPGTPGAGLPGVARWRATATKEQLAAGQPSPTASVLRPGSELAPEEAEDAFARFKAIQEDLQSETAKATESIGQQQRAIAQLYTMTDEQLEAQGKTREGLNAELAAATAGLNKQMDAVIAKGGAAAKEAEDKLKALAEAGLLGAQQVALGWEKTAKAIDEALKNKAITAEQAALSKQTLREDVRAQVIPLQLELKAPTVDAILPKIALISAALEQGLYVSAEEAAKEIQLLVQQLESAKMTGFAAEVERWSEALKQLEARGVDAQAFAEFERASREALGPIRALREAEQLAMTDYEKMLEAAVVPLRQLQEGIAQLYALPDEQLLSLGVDRAQLDRAVADIGAAVEEAAEKANEAQYKVNEFGLQAARTLQTTFADAFMSIGEGWNEVGRNFLNSFKRIFAEAAALQLTKALGLDEILEGKKPTRGAGKLIGMVFPGTDKRDEDKKKPEPAVAEAVQKAVAAAPELKVEKAAPIPVDAPASIPVDAPASIPITYEQVPAELTRKPTAESAAPLQVEIPPPLAVEKVAPIPVDAPESIACVCECASERVPAALAEDLAPLAVEKVAPIQVEVPPELTKLSLGVDSRGKPTDRAFPVDARGFPIDTTRPRIENADDSFSTEETITEWVDGMWRNIPTIVDGVRVTAEEAVSAAVDAMAKGWEFPSFDTLAEAEAEAPKRSAMIAAAREQSAPAEMGRVIEGCCADMRGTVEDVGVRVAETTEAVRTTDTETPSAAAGKEGAAGPMLRELGASIEGMLNRFTGGIYGLLKPLITEMLKMIGGAAESLWTIVKAAIAALTTSAAAKPAAEAAGSAAGALITTMFVAAGGLVPAVHAAVVGEEAPEVVAYRAGGGELPRVVGAKGPEVVSASRPAQVINVRQLEFAGVMRRAGTDHREQIAAKMQAAVAPLGERSVNTDGRQLVDVTAAPAVVNVSVAPLAGVAPASLGGSAGGGRMAADKPRLVGEEAPELMGAARAAVAGQARSVGIAASTALGDVMLEFKPQYNVVMNGARSDGELFSRMATYIEQQDQRNKADIMEMLRRNGFGRMSR